MCNDGTNEYDYEDYPLLVSEELSLLCVHTSRVIDNCPNHAVIRNGSRLDIHVQKKATNNF